MESRLGLWIVDNAELFKYVAELPSLKSDAMNVLLSGKVSSYLASTLSLMYKDAKIVAVDEDDKAVEEAKTECPHLQHINEKFTDYQGSGYDIAISALEIEMLNTRELTPYLFNLYDSLSSGGVLFLSFPDAVAPTVMEKNLYPAWYDEDEMIYMKYYMAGDVANALSMIGFQIKSMEADNNNDLLHVVTLIAQKN